MPPRRGSRSASGIDLSDHADAESDSDEQDVASSSAAGGFLFITDTGQKRQSRKKQERKTLRAHVMHNYLEKNHAEKQEPEATLSSVMPSKKERPASRTTVSSGQKMRFRLVSDGLQQRSPYRHPNGKKRNKPRNDAADSKRVLDSQTSTVGFPTALRHIPGYPLTLLNPQTIDPFGTLAIELNTKDEIFLHRFSKLNRYPWCPINGQSDWSIFAVSDQLVFHATMYSWGMHFRHRTPAPRHDEEVQVIQHKLAAISLINDRLSDPDAATGDATIAAVAALTNIALISDSYPEASKHMRGMDAIIAKRGGLSTLGSGVQLHLRRLLSWNDLIYSEVFDEKLRFPPIEVRDEAWGAFQPTDGSTSLPGLSYTELRAARVPRHEVLQLLDDIRGLCQAEQASPLLRIDEQGRMKRSDMFLRVEMRLRLIVQVDTRPGKNRWDATVWRAASLAAMMFTHHHLRGNPLKYRHFPVLSMQLYDTLRSMSEELTEFDFAPGLLIWVLSTGAVVSTNVGGAHQSFVTMLTRACMRYGLTNWDQYRWMLCGFLWTGEADEKRYSRLWQEVQQSMLAGYQK
ncbi:hypothetical protein PV11_03629 [Exophiala sideris]|uniref:Tachykinin family protein n=1 Tax=Exophiala sideris TaxID=1016849 RepID=A0A0D1VYI0_9EURO|nr:hypothetical protein PV11_03629 [Exophiala sideris]